MLCREAVPGALAGAPLANGSTFNQGGQPVTDHIAAAEVRCPLGARHSGWCHGSFGANVSTSCERRNQLGAECFTAAGMDRGDWGFAPATDGTTDNGLRRVRAGIASRLRPGVELDVCDYAADDASFRAACGGAPAWRVPAVLPGRPLAPARVDCHGANHAANCSVHRARAGDDSADPRCARTAAALCNVSMELRIRGGGPEGIVEVRPNPEAPWGVMCRAYYTPDEYPVWAVCNTLGIFSLAVSSNGGGYSERGIAWVHDVHCTDSDQTLWECSYNIDDYRRDNPNSGSLCYAQYVKCNEWPFWGIIILAILAPITPALMYFGIKYICDAPKRRRRREEDALLRALDARGGGGVDADGQDELFDDDVPAVLRPMNDPASAALVAADDEDTEPREPLPRLVFEAPELETLIRRPADGDVASNEGETTFATVATIAQAVIDAAHGGSPPADLSLAAVPHVAAAFGARVDAFAGASMGDEALPDPSAAFWAVFDGSAIAGANAACVRVGVSTLAARDALLDSSGHRHIARLVGVSPAERSDAFASVAEHIVNAAGLKAPPKRSVAGTSGAQPPAMAVSAWATEAFHPTETLAVLLRRVARRAERSPPDYAARVALRKRLARVLHGILDGAEHLHRCGLRPVGLDLGGVALRGGTLDGDAVITTYAPKGPSGGGADARVFAEVSTVEALHAVALAVASTCGCADTVPDVDTLWAVPLPSAIDALRPSYGGAAARSPPPPAKISANDAVDEILMSPVLTETALPKQHERSTNSLPARSHVSRECNLCGVTVHSAGRAFLAAVCRPKDVDAVVTHKEHVVCAECVTARVRSAVHDDTVDLDTMTCPLGCGGVWLLSDFGQLLSPSVLRRWRKHAVAVVKARSLEAATAVLDESEKRSAAARGDDGDAGSENEAEAVKAAAAMTPEEADNAAVRDHAAAIRALLRPACPHCGLPFESFTGCVAVFCGAITANGGLKSGCGKVFCGACMTPSPCRRECGHEYVRQAELLRRWRSWRTTRPTEYLREHFFDGPKDFDPDRAHSDLQLRKVLRCVRRELELVGVWPLMELTKECEEAAELPAPPPPPKNVKVTLPKPPATANSDAAKEENEEVKRDATRGRLARFYAKYNPTRTEADIEEAVRRFAGREEALFAALVRKYGPEPEPEPEPETRAVVDDGDGAAVADPEARRPQIVEPLNVDPRSGLPLIDVPADRRDAVANSGALVLHFWADVDRVSSRGRTLRRVLFVTDTTVFVWDPTGSLPLSRCVPVSRIAQVHVSADHSNCVAFVIPTEYDLIVRFEQRQQRDDAVVVLRAVYRRMTGGGELPVERVPQTLPTRYRMEKPRGWQLQVAPQTTRAELRKTLETVERQEDTPDATPPQNPLTPVASKSPRPIDPADI